MAQGHGGKREGAGRPPKADEALLAEKLGPMDDIAFEALKAGIKKKAAWAIRMFMEYRFGKPKERVIMEDAKVQVYDFSQLTDEELNAYYAICDKIGLSE